MKIDLSGKTALVTGSTGGIGFAIAKGLAESGASVILNGPTQELVDEALNRLKDQLPTASGSGVFADLETAEGAQKLSDNAPIVDVLVNNLGIYAAKDFFEIEDDEWHRFFDINVMAGIRLSRAYLPGMRDRNWGRVLFLSSESSVNVPADMLHYGMTKTAVLSISRGLAKRMAGTGVTVNAVLPGPTLSDGLIALLKEQQKGSDKSLDEIAKDFIQANRPSSIIQRPSKVEEIANMVVYLSSPLSSSTTGAALRVDGGVAEFIL